MFNAPPVLIVTAPEIIPLFQFTTALDATVKEAPESTVPLLQFTTEPFSAVRELPDAIVPLVQFKVALEVTVMVAPKARLIVPLKFWRRVLVPLQLISLS